MAKDYVFYKVIERPVDEARTSDPKIEGHYADISEQLREISHFLNLNRDKDETIREVRYYVPGILNQSSVKFEFHNRTKQQVEVTALVHTTGLVPRLNRQLAEKLDALGYHSEKAPQKSVVTFCLE